MKVIVCLDDNNGMMFFKKRQSMDKVLREKVFDLIGNNKLYLSNYSKRQFEENPNLVITDDFSNVSEDDYVFIEDKEIIASKVKEFILFYWNRRYPADKYFKEDLSDFTLVSEEDFKGNSHDKITMKRFKRN